MASAAGWGDRDSSRGRSGTTCSLEPPAVDIGHHLILVDIRDALARQGSLSNEVGVVEHEATLDANLERSPVLVEIPGVEPTHLTCR